MRVTIVFITHLSMVHKQCGSSKGGKRLWKTLGDLLRKDGQLNTHLD